MPDANIRYVQEDHAALPENTDVINTVLAILSTGTAPLSNAIKAQAFAGSFATKVVACSPIQVTLTNSGGQSVGPILRQVDNALYLTVGHGTQISAPVVPYTLAFQGVGTGTFTLIVSEVDATGNELQHTAFINIPVAPQSKGTATISGASVGALQLDVDGDGTIDAQATAGALNPLVAVQLLEKIVDSYGLAHGTETSLSAKLDAAIASLQRGNKQAANGQMQAFENEVIAQSGKKLTAEIANGLVQISEAILATL